MKKGVKFLKGRLLLFLENEMGSYTNSKDVDIDTDGGNRILVYAGIQIPGQDDFSLQVEHDCKNVCEFIDAYQIRQFSQLDEIRPEDVLSLYEKGQALIYCTVYSQQYWFTRVFPDGVKIEGDEMEPVYKLTTPQGPEDFLKLALQQFFLR